MMSKRILLVEDEKSISRFIELELKHEQFEVTVAYDGRSGLDLAMTESFDVLLLDVMLPHLNGIEVCRRVRKESNIPIILLTARDAVMDRVAGLDAGADDYIVKPFAIEELLARIRSILRRTTVEEKQTFVQFNEIKIDEDAYIAYVEDTALQLTKTEYDLLTLLVKNQNKVCTREQILTTVWGYDSEVETNVIDVYIRHLRSKLPQHISHYIETVRGVGYVMRQ